MNVFTALFMRNPVLAGGSIVDGQYNSTLVTQHRGVSRRNFNFNPLGKDYDIFQYYLCMVNTTRVIYKPLFFTVIA